MNFEHFPKIVNPKSLEFILFDDKNRNHQNEEDMVNVKIKRITIRTTDDNRNSIRWMGVWFDRVKDEKIEKCVPNVFLFSSSQHQPTMICVRENFMRQVLQGDTFNVKKSLRQYLNKYPPNVNNHWNKVKLNSLVVNYLYDTMDDTLVNSLSSYMKNEWGNGYEYHEIDTKKNSKGVDEDLPFVEVAIEGRHLLVPSRRVYNQEICDWDISKIEPLSRQSPMVLQQKMMCYLSPCSSISFRPININEC